MAVRLSMQEEVWKYNVHGYLQGEHNEMEGEQGKPLTTALFLLAMLNFPANNELESGSGRATCSY